MRAWFFFDPQVVSVHMHAPAFNRTLRLSFGFIFTGEETLAFSGTKLKPWKNTAAFNVL